MHFLLLFFAVIGILTTLALLGVMVLFWSDARALKKLKEDGFFD